MKAIGGVNHRTSTSAPSFCDLEKHKAIRRDTKIKMISVPPLGEVSTTTVE